MQFQKIGALRLLRKIGIGLLVAAAIFWIVGIAWAPSWIKKSLEEYSQRAGYQIELLDIHVKPFALKVELQGLKLKEIKGKELFSL
ncbi:MAG: hypothetical protein RLZZ620_589, partial [Pseudomonadota bacterium]